MHTVDKDWLHKHKTKKGGWNSKQLKVLGIKWPPPKGWTKAVEGKVITEDEAKIFEGEAGTTSKTTWRRKWKTQEAVF